MMITFPRSYLLYYVCPIEHLPETLLWIQLLQATLDTKDSPGTVPLLYTHTGARSAPLDTM